MTALEQSEHRRHPIVTEEDVGALRRAVAQLAAWLPAIRRGEAELVATELGTNLLRHASPGGYVLYRRAGDGMELLSVDHGPGRAPVSSSAPSVPSPPTAPGPAGPPPFLVGGLGAGLATVQRLATEFDLYSTPRGTVVLARLATTSVSGRWRFGAVNIPYGGTGESGDAWAVAPDRRLAALVVDGLGHGPHAAAAAHMAVTTFGRQPVADLGHFMEQAHHAMRSTRGGVLGACVIDPEHGGLRFAGIGNVTGRVLVAGQSHHLLGRPGTLGTHLPFPRPHLEDCRWDSGATLILTTDGIRTAWDLADHPGLLAHHPAVIAAVLHREHGKPADDATVLVVRDMT